MEITFAATTFFDLFIKSKPIQLTKSNLNELKE